MFSRRSSRRPRPAVDPSTQAAATTAASSAFLHKTTSQASLSSAAASAALRSHTTSPEPVGSIQTKRMVRRGSASSQGSGSVMGGGRPGLVRADSSGSMTERTFRAASPMQKNGSNSPAPASPRGNVRPASSLGYTPRLTSPPPTNGNRSSSADEATRIPASNARQSKRLSNVAEVDAEADDNEDLGQAHANFAKNFARRTEPEQELPSSPPASPPASPSAKKFTHGMGNWFRQGSADKWPITRPQNTDGRTYSLTSNPRSTSGSTVTNPANIGRPASAAGYTGSRDRVYGIRPGTSYALPPKVYDPNSRSFVYASGSQPPQYASQSPSRLSKVETVYDPNSRTFVPKVQATRNETPPQRTVVSPVPAASVIAPKKQRAAPAALTPVQPPPKNPARFSQDETTLATPPAAPAVPKQPPIARQEPKFTGAAGAAVSTTEEQAGAKRNSAVLPAKTYASPTRDAQRSASLDVPSLGMEPAGRGRVASQSPQRAAHFSPSPILKPTRHEPPARDISPAKSAMKHSPASSVRTASPIASFSALGIANAAGPPSETSETPSLASQDGVSGKRKKSVRVSFDEHAQEIAPAAVIASMAAASSLAEENDDIAMQPRPALPSFGSVRRDRMQAQLAEKVTEMPPARHDASNDHALAGILRKNNDPLPPEVTSKETAGYVSDESSDADVPAPTTGVAQPPKPEIVEPSEDAATNIRDFASNAVTTPSDDVDVPSIALMPPTPKLDDDSKRDLGPVDEETLKMNRNSMEGITVPGGWNKDEDTPQPPTIVEPPKATPEIFDGGPTAPTVDAAATTSPSPIQLTASPLQLSDIDEDSDDAEFSDALEDPSDLEDEGTGGFASLNAIVESPLAPSSPTIVKQKPVDLDVPESPSVQQTAKKTVVAPDSPELPPSPSNANWGEATAYWSQLSKEKRAQIERQHFSSDDESLPPVAPTKKLRPKSAQLADKRPLSTASTKKQQPAQPAMRQSMRAQPSPASAGRSDNATHMRTSMRDGGGKRTSLREAASQRRQSVSSNDGSVVMQKTMRPVSSSALSTSSIGTEGYTPRQSLQSNRKSQDSAYPTLRTNNATSRPRSEMPQVSTRLQKELAKVDDSDSESSFRKRRRNKAGADGRYTMRGSMRDASYDQPAPAIAKEPERPSSPTKRATGAFGRLRSMSPPFTRNRASSFGQSSQDSNMRSTLRAGSSTKLQPPPQGKSKARQTPASAPRFRSRFADSDDEEEDTAAPSRSFFRSRFADSDDDEPGSSVVIPANLTPVRGIPRRKGQEDGDSTDLEDDDDAPATKTTRKSGKAPLIADSEVDKVMELARKNLGLAEPASAQATTTPANEGDALQKGSLRAKPVEDETPPSTAKPADINFSPPDRKKKGFMGSILRRNRNSSSSIPTVRPTSPPPVPASPAVPSPAVAEASSPGLNLAKSAEPSTPTRPPMNRLRKSSNPTRAARSNSNLSTTLTTPTQTEPIPPVPKLPDSELDSWARPSSPAAVTTTSIRPSTSDGLSPDPVKSSRPDLGLRSQSQQLSERAGRRVQIQAGEEGSEPGEREPRSAVQPQRTGKKKKFGTLRRVFGLDD